MIGGQMKTPEKRPIKYAMGLKVKEIRESKDWSQAFLAEKCGWSQSRIGNYESGRNGMDRPTVAVIAAALGVSESEILLVDAPTQMPFDPAINKALTDNIAFMHEINNSMAAANKVDSEVVAVPRLDVSASMGPGSIVPDYDVVAEEIVLRKDWVARNLNITNTSNLAMITGSGDSMQPTFYDGDVLIVDSGIKDVITDAVYVLTINDQLYIKRLQRRPDGSILMISDNKQYEPYLIEDGERDKFSVLGRVKLAWISKKL
jgi:phage repressor protein C with HTH and peptisase S24 domain